MENLLISACLLGVSCRYDGKSKPLPGIEKLRERYALIPVCPEIFGGLPTPRKPAERSGDKVLTENGGNVTEEYTRGAAEILRLAKFFGCKKALLKERSPACGSGKIYDGTFTKTLTDGFGIAAALLSQNGVSVFGETEIEELMK